MNLKRGWRLASPTEKRQAEADRSFSHLSQIADFSPECSVVHTFPISSEKAHKSAHRLQQVDLLWIVTFGNGNIESYGGNQIIVLIVHIVTLFLNGAKSFSLFNAMQILCIPIGETQAEKSAVVFIVLIVFIVTLFLNEAKSFSLFNATQILYPQNKTDQAFTVTMSRHSNDHPQFPLYAPRRVAVFKKTDIPVTYLIHL